MRAGNIGIMDSLTFLLGVAIVAIAGLVGIAVYLANQRAVERMTQESLNYRAELRAGGRVAPSNNEGEPDMLSQLLTLAMQNPELVKQVLGGLQGQTSGQMSIPGMPPKQE